MSEEQNTPFNLANQSRKATYAFGSAFIVFGFLCIVASFIVPALYETAAGWMIPGLLSSISMIIFGALISEKAAGGVPVKGFTLSDEDLDNKESFFLKKKLKDLHQAGLLSDEEYQQKYKEVEQNEIH